MFFTLDRYTVRAKQLIPYVIARAAHARHTSLSSTAAPINLIKKQLTKSQIRTVVMPIDAPVEEKAEICNIYL
jgi:uncharacterized protein (DUF1778 family)